LFKSLVIGCGNIGALYDFDSEEVLTHTKAYSKNTKFDLTIFDLNIELAHKIAAKYNCTIQTELLLDTLKKYDVVSVCTPTDTHLSILEKCIDAGVKLIICEKPVSNKIEELESIEKKYNQTNSKIIVNYIRRFQPAYIDLKTYVQELLTKEILTNISVRYQRGFINNCSHAFDLIEFLSGLKIKVDSITETARYYDHFPHDPTLSFGANWNTCNISVIGLSYVKFSHFEIDLYFEHQKIKISDAGQTIEIFVSEENTQFLKPLQKQEQFTRTASLKNYMVNVIDHASKILEGKEISDNFLNSTDLNKRMLSYI
jgi:predicted dehydrogenase